MSSRVTPVWPPPWLAGSDPPQQEWAELRERRWGPALGDHPGPGIDSKGGCRDVAKLAVIYDTSNDPEAQAERFAIQNEPPLGDPANG